MKKFIQTILLCIGALVVTPGVSANINHSELLKAADIKASGEYVRKRFLERMKQPFDQKEKKKALIIGDSHAQDFLNSVLENQSLSDYQISTRYIPTRCQIHIGDEGKKHIAAKDKSFCEKADDLEKSRQQIAEADLIILVANWKEWSATLLPNTIEQLKLSDDQRLYVVGRKSFGKISIRKYLRMPDKELVRLRNKPEANHIKINEIMRQSLSEDMFINLHEIVCGKTEQCPVFTDDLKLISFDGGHLTKDGAKYIGKVIFQNSALGNL